jgi:large subunit ribosomal protein L21
VVRTGGKQYRVREGDVLRVASVDAAPGSSLELRDILLVSDGGEVTVGKPTVDGAVVVAEVLQHGKGPKVINFKYKAKVRYRRKRGHRQGFTALGVRWVGIGTPPAFEPSSAAADSGDDAAEDEETKEE